MSMKVYQIPHFLAWSKKVIAHYPCYNKVKYLGQMYDIWQSSTSRGRRF